MSSQTIAVSANACLTAFQDVLSGPNATETERLQQQLARFNFWAANIGVFAPSRASLDTRLSARGGIKYRPLILQLLNVLQKNLSTASTASTQPVDSNIGVDGDDVSYLDSLEAIQDLIDRLHKLSASIRKSAVRDRNSKAANFVERDDDGNDLSTAFESNAIRIIEQRYPDASEPLCNRLGQSVSLRRKRILYNRRHQVKLANIGWVPDRAAVPVQLPDLPVMPSVPAAITLEPSPPKPEPLPEEAPVAVSVRPSETAASIPESDVQSTMALSRVSSASSGSMLQDQGLKYPRKPKRNPFTGEASCPYCSAILTDDEIMNPKAWRRHIKRDIEPYVCIADSCNAHTSTFHSFKQWLKHFQQEHRIQWHCIMPIHAPVSFTSKEDFEQHMLQDHQGKITSKQLSTFARIAARPAQRAFDNCPLCKVGPDSVEPAEGMTHDVIPDRLPRHVAGHLKSLALMFLPPGENGTDDETDSQLSSRTGQSSRKISQSDSGSIITFDDHQKRFALSREAIDEPITAENSDWTFLLGDQYSGPEMDPTLQTFVERTRSQPLQKVGSECAVCEEPLEHTLFGERILQFSCSHVSHEQCFYEYIKQFDTQSCPTCNAPLSLDTSRGGNVLDIEKLSSIVRSVPLDGRSSNTPTPTPWDNQTVRPPSRESNARPLPRESRDSNGIAYRDTRETRDSSRDSQDRYAPTSRHGRSDSEATGGQSSTGYPETSVSGPPRRHDYDVQAMETNLISPRASVTKNPIPPPFVSVRSEFPTLTRSRQQQTLTCLVTIEVPDSKWRPDPDNLRTAPLVPAIKTEEVFDRTASPERNAPRFYPYEPPEVLEEITESLRLRVDNWHGLDFSRFGKLRLYGTIRVGKDKQAWQELECFLFAEMLICVKEKKIPGSSQWDDGSGRKTTRCALKGSILIKKHLKEVTHNSSEADNVLTLSLSVAELPSFHLQFENLNQLKLWQQALLDLNAVEGSPVRSPDYDNSETEEDDWQRVSNPKRVSSLNSSSYGAGRSATTAPTEYTSATKAFGLPTAVHVPIDIVVVIPISSSMQGVKISLVRDALKFMVQNLGDRDRMGLVTFGSSGGGVPLVGMTTKAWSGWSNILASIRPVGQKSHRADVVEGANVAMDLLMQRKSNNPIATILLISDSSISDADSVDFVVSRAEAAKIAIHSFGLGMTHKPDTMIELSTRTKASYTYVKDWMMLRECLAGCLGALQTMSHQNVKLKLRLPEGSPAKFVKISGAVQITKRATGRDAEAALGDMRFGDKRDILVQLVIAPDNASTEQLPQDPWESIVSGLEALGGPLEQEDQRTVSVDEVPLIQADLTWGDILRDGTLTHLPRPSLLAITMLLATSSQNTKKSAWPNTPPIPPHPSVVQRRMELLTSDMLTRALTLVSRGQHDRAQTLLNETRSILKGLGKGGLPPNPPSQKSPNPANSNNTSNTTASSLTSSTAPDRRRTPSPTSTPSSAHPPSSSGTIPALPHSRSSDTLTTATTYPASSSHPIDPATVAALDSELEASLEWINHPAVFGRDSRKAVLQAISVISSQRGYTFRTPMESLWAERVEGVRRLGKKSREWRDEGGAEIIEEN